MSVPCTAQASASAVLFLFQYKILNSNSIKCLGCNIKMLNILYYELPSPCHDKLKFLMKITIPLVWQEEQALAESLAQEKNALLDAREESKERIRELEEDIKTLTQRAVERETELERYFIFFLSLCIFYFS